MNNNLNEASSESQNARILEHLQSGKTITGIEALSLYGCFRLPARIADLKALGHDIDKNMVIVPNNKKHVASYYLKSKIKNDEKTGL